MIRLSLLALLALATPSHAQMPKSRTAFVCEGPAPLDGDTMICQGGLRVRLWGVQAPERHEPAGPAATRALATIIRGQSLTCTAKGRSYNRVVAQCFAGRLDVAGVMVRQGHAVDWPKFSGGYYRRGR